jgi:nicotinamide-nucleotide amidase
LLIECIAIGTELLTTTRVDTNSVWLAQRLADLGLGFSRKTVVGDGREEMAALFREALDRSEFIVCTGGLGPTFDDLTKELWAEVLGDDLIEDEAIWREIQGFYTTRQRAMPSTNRKQALVPASARALHNPMGTAPGILWESPKGHPGTRIVLLPGVPREMKNLWETEVEPILRPLSGPRVHTLRMLVGSAGESALDMRTTPLREKHGHLDWTILAGLGAVELVARSTDAAALEAARRDFEQELGIDLAFVGGGSLEERVLELLSQRGETLAVAESMTGGTIQARLTGVPGSSSVFRGGAVVYSASAKNALADVDASLIQAHGTVSEAVTRALAEGIARKLDATWGLATTGNAGPSEDKDGPAPVGTCLMAVWGPAGTAFQAQSFPGVRVDIQTRSTTWALDFLRRQIQDFR